MAASDEKFIKLSEYLIVLWAISPVEAGKRVPAIQNANKFGGIVDIEKSAGNNP